MTLNEAVASDKRFRRKRQGIHPWPWMSYDKEMDNIVFDTLERVYYSGLNSELKSARSAHVLISDAIADDWEVEE